MEGEEETLRLKISQRRRETYDFRRVRSKHGRKEGCGLLSLFAKRSGCLAFSAGIVTKRSPLSLSLSPYVSSIFRVLANSVGKIGWGW